MVSKYRFSITRPRILNHLKGISHIHSQKDSKLSKMAQRMPSIPTVSTFTCGNIPYFVRNRIEHIISSAEPIASIIPAIVINSTGKDGIAWSYIRTKLDEFHNSDDVYTSEFAEKAAFILLYETENPPQPDQELSDFFKDRSPGSLIFQKKTEDVVWHEGPYFLANQELHQSWRVYPDNLGAFTSTVIPDDENDMRFIPFRATSAEGFHLGVAVPSRLYFPKNSDKPLNGLRISIKDNFHLAGTVTTLGSRAWARLYGVQDSTSAYVERLVKLGCVVVGKTKLSSFAGTETPPNGPIDYLAPFNPRADLYQNPSGSSMGAASAIAGYEWLDISLATDTTGSTRLPAASNGVWALRPTWGSISTEGIIRSVELFDTVGLLARDGGLLHSFHEASLDLAPIEKEPIRILYPTDWFPANSDKHQEIMNEYISSLESHLGISRTEVSLSELWSNTGPEGERDQALKDYVGKIGYNINMWDGYHNFAEFREAYEREYNEKPYISPTQTSKWGGGSKVTAEERAEAVRRRDIFSKWVHENVIGDSQDTVMVVWYGDLEPSYRDAVFSAPMRFPGSYNPNFFTTILGLPTAVIPVGHVPFHSRVTDRTEYLPAVAGLVGGPGMDRTIVKLSHDALAKAGFPTKVLPGRLAFKPEEKLQGTTGRSMDATKL